MQRSTLATSDWVCKTLHPAFGQFAARWRDHKSPETAGFLPLFINGQSAGWLNREHAHEIALVMQGAFAEQANVALAPGSRLELDLPAEYKHDEAFAALAFELAKRGLMNGWRNEWQWVTTTTHAQLARAERALFKTLGLQSQAIHVHVENAQGQVWVGVRALSKHENPGMLDNLSAGGVANGESIESTLWRELHEEAGLFEADFDELQALYAGDNALVVSRPLLHGGWHHEKIHLYKARLKQETVPSNQDGEVQAFQLMCPEACTRSLNGWAFTPDAGLCTALALQST